MDLSSGLVSHISGLVIYTSALLAIARHVDTNNAESFEEKKQSIKNIEFGVTNTNNGMNKVKDQWDVLVVGKPTRLNPPMHVLFVAFVLYPSLYVGSVWIPNDSPNWTLFANILLTIFYIGLTIITVVIIIKMRTMNEERRNFSNDVDTFLKMHEIVISTISLNNDIYLDLTALHKSCKHDKDTTIVKARNAGFKVKDISVFFDISTTTVYKICKKH